MPFPRISLPLPLPPELDLNCIESDYLVLGKDWIGLDSKKLFYIKTTLCRVEGFSKALSWFTTNLWSLGRCAAKPWHTSPGGMILPTYVGRHAYCSILNVGGGSCPAFKPIANIFFTVANLAPCARFAYTTQISSHAIRNIFAGQSLESREENIPDQKVALDH